MSEKIVLITGASDGIGKQVALELSKLNYQVIIHGRNSEKLEVVKTMIKEKTGNEVKIELADLSSFTQINAMCDRIIEQYERIDIMINNAGVQMHDRELSEDGFEMTFAVNHLAYFLITSRLLHLVRKSNYKRIILVASQLHAKEIDFDDLQSEKEYSLYPVYAKSKLCNFLFGYKLSELLKPEGITVSLVHPGLIDTNLNPKRSPDVVARALPVEQGSVSTIHAALSQELEGITGKYFWFDATEATSSDISYDKDAQDKLWEITERLVGEKFRF